jgi:hypothetical protein
VVLDGGVGVVKVVQLRSYIIESICMNHLCPHCNCILTLDNRAKKDKLRYRGICKSCFRDKRNNYLRNKKKNKFLKMINERILKINFDPHDHNWSLYKLLKDHLFTSVRYIKNKIRRISNGL